MHAQIEEKQIYSCTLLCFRKSNTSLIYSWKMVNPFNKNISAYGCRHWLLSILAPITRYQIPFVPHLILFILDYTRPQQSGTCHQIKITPLRRRYQNQSARVIRYRVLNLGLKHHYSITVGIRHIMGNLNKTILHAIERSMLSETVKQGWPESKSMVDHVIREYWSWS